MKHALMTAALAVLVAALTWVFGWWTVLAASAVAGATCHRQGGRPGSVAAAAALAWGGLLLFAARDGRLGVLATSLGGVFPVPGVALLLLTVLFAAAAAWSSAVIGAHLTHLLTRRAGNEARQ